MRKQSWIEVLRRRKPAGAQSELPRGKEEYFQPRLRRLEDRRVLSATVMAIDAAAGPTAVVHGAEIAIVEPLVSDGAQPGTNAQVAELDWNSGREPELPGAIAPAGGGPAAHDGAGGFLARSELAHDHDSSTTEISSLASADVVTNLQPVPQQIVLQNVPEVVASLRSEAVSTDTLTPTIDSADSPATPGKGMVVSAMVAIPPQPAEPLLKISATTDVSMDLAPFAADSPALSTELVASHRAEPEEALLPPIGLSNLMAMAGGPSNLSISVDQSEISEAGSISLTGSFDNPGSPDAHTVAITWGDGGQTTITLLPGDATFAATYTYLDDNPTGTPFDSNSINVAVTDQSGNSVSADTLVKVNNAAPANLAISLTPAVISEGGSVTLTGSFADVGPLDSHTVEISWGDGSSNTNIALAPGQKTFSTSHTYADDDPSVTGQDSYNVSVTVTDDDTGAVTDTTSALVQNVPPDNLLLTLSDLVIFEDGTVTLEGTFDDPGSTDAHELTIDWGDGSPPTTLLLPVGDRQFSIDHQYLDDNPTGTPFDSYEINASLADDDGGATTATTQIQVNNVIPQLSHLAATTTNENGVTTLTGQIADWGTQDTYTLKVNWGDPLSPNNVETYTLAAGTTNFTLTHQYLDDNPTGTPSDKYSIELRLTDDDTGQDIEATNVTVNNVAPALGNLVATTVDEHGTTTLTGTITDPGTLDTFTLQVNWGDPLSPNNVETYTFAAGTTNFTLTHQYLDDNPTGTPTDNYTIGLTLSDDDTGQDVENATVTVNNVAPVLSNLVATTIDENGVTTLTGTITDPGTLDTFTLQVNWGDPLSPNNVETYTFAAGTTNFTLTHQYLDDNPTGTPTDNYTIGLTLTDDDTGQDVENATVTVNNVAPSIHIPASLTILENGSLTIDFSDPGTLDSHTVVVDWGDGTPVETISIGPNAPRQVSHQYLDDNPTGTPQDNYTVTIQVTDDDTGVDQEQFVVTVVNVDPLLQNLTASTISENGTTTLQGTIVDPGSQDDFVLTVNWGDPLSPNNVETYTFAAGTTNFTLTHQYLDDNPSGTAADNYTISLQAVDDDTGVGTATTPVTVLNVNPAFTDIVGSTIDENDVATVTAQIVDIGSLDTFTLEVDWGDDNAPQLISISNLGFSDASGTINGTQYQWTAATRTIVLQHQYLDDGDVPGDGDPVDVHTVVLRAIDDDTGVGLDQAAVTVNDLPPQILAVAATQINPLGQTTLTLNFSDVGTTDAFVVAVDWGDGQPPQLISLPAGTTSMTEVHSYFAPPDPANPTNDIPINVTVQDDDSLTDAALTFADVPGENLLVGAALYLPTAEPLEFPVVQNVASTPAPVPPPLSSVRTFDDVRSRAEIVVGSDRRIVLRTVSIEGVESSREFVLPESTLDDLRKLFAGLPDGRYRIYLRQDKIDRLIFDVMIRQGRPVDTADNQDGTLDRPPTSEVTPSNPATDATKPDAEYPEADQTEAELQPEMTEQSAAPSDWSKPARLARAIRRRASAC